MAITSYTFQRTGCMTVVTVVSDLEGTVLYHWYLDGVYVGMTHHPERGFLLEVGDQADVQVNDTIDPDYDAVANAPVVYPANRTLWWVRSLDETTVAYRVEQKLGAGDWEEIGTVYRDGAQWDYSFLTPRLDDLGLYYWQIIPVDASGNDGTAVSADSETIVRKPDAPDFDIAFDSGTTKVAFSEAA